MWVSLVGDFGGFVCCELRGVWQRQRATDKVIKGRDHETDKEAGWERGGGLLPSDCMSI